ncbi:MAG: hypothetical protein Q9222_001479 [Ikaeria aurantiellina]
MSDEKRSRFLELPAETQKHIFSYLGQKELLISLTVSPIFHHLACIQLYRNLEFKIHNSENRDDVGSSMQTAEALQTIITSDYNYAQHIKSLRVVMVDDNTQTSTIMSKFTWDRSGFASKALNTSLLLLVKRATALESFLWDVPIDLSGAVYQELQRNLWLRHLRLQLDVALSLKLTIHPGPLPGSSGVSHHPPSTSMPSSFPTLIPSGSSNQLGPLKSRIIRKKKAGSRNFWSGNRDFSGFKHLDSLSLLGVSTLDYLEEIGGCLRSSSNTLKSFSLSLSYETALRGRKISAAPPPPDDATSDEEEDELIDPPSVTGSTPSAPISTEADIRKEKQAQDAILARIFDMEQFDGESKRLERDLILSNEKRSHLPGFKKIMQDVKAMTQTLSRACKTGLADDSIALEAIEMVHKATAGYLNGESTTSENPLLEQIAASGPNGNGEATGNASPPSNSTQKMVEGPFLLHSDPQAGPSSASHGETSEATKVLQDHVASNDFGIFEDPIQHHYHPPAASDGTGPLPPWPTMDSSTWQGDFSAGGILSPGVTGSTNGLGTPIQPSSHHDLAFAVPPLIANNTAEAQIMPAGSHEANLNQTQKGNEPPSLPADAVPLTSTLLTNEPADDSADIDMVHPDEDPNEVIDDQEIVSEDEEHQHDDIDGADLPSPRKRVRFEASNPPAPAEVPVSSSSKIMENTSPGDVSGEKDQSAEEAMQAWIREKHGYQLEEIKLDWIPMRAGILSRALDLAVLRRITLLHCGSQDGFWMILAGLQSRQGTIALKSIHTDNVSKSFLKCLRSFNGLTELFLHERSRKEIEATTSSQGKTTITEIRQQILRKHLKTLERLMIKNEADSNWDLDAITITLMSNKGSNLVELAASLSAKHFHNLMQNLSALKNLQALHLLAVRGAGQGGALSNLEYLNSTVDNLSHHPSTSRLKYVAVDNILSHIQRRSAAMTRKFKQAKASRQLKRVQMEAMKQAKMALENGGPLGKGKEKETDYASDASSETDFPDDKDLHEMYSLKVKAAVLTDMKEVEHIKIFQNQYRAGSF